MKRRSARLILILFFSLLWGSQELPSGGAGAAEPRQPYQIGVLTTSWGPTPSELEFAINLKVAKVLGLTVAPEVIFRADRLIR